MSLAFAKHFSKKQLAYLRHAGLGSGNQLASLPNTRRASLVAAGGTAAVVAANSVPTTFGTAAITLPTPAVPWLRTNFLSAATANSPAFVTDQPSHLWSQKPLFQAGVNPGGVITLSRFWLGLANAVWTNMLGSDTPGSTFAVSGAGFRFSATTADANWMCATYDGVGQTVVNSGVPVAAGAGKLFEIYDGGTSTSFRINGVEVASIATTRPAAAAVMRMGWGVQTLEAVAKSVDLGWLYTQTEVAVP